MYLLTLQSGYHPSFANDETEGQRGHLIVIDLLRSKHSDFAECKTDYLSYCCVQTVEIRSSSTGSNH
jgi:hypothetical protein